MATKRKRIFRTIIIVFTVLCVITGVLGYRYYNYLFKPNIDLGGKKSVYIHIPTGSGYEDVLEILEKENVLLDQSSFEWVAKKKKYNLSIKAGKYLIKTGTNNNSLVNMLRSGRQEPVKLTFNNIRLKSQLAGTIAKQIEADSAQIMKLFSDKKLMQKYGFKQENSILLFIPNTYEVYWNTSAEELFERMYDEYNRFWTPERKQKAKEHGFSPIEIGVLASIVQKETNKSDEMSRVAGVYVNRIKRGIALQADPTVIFAIGDFTIKRVLKRHLEFDSRYNTYKYPGLPPGPICLPSTITLKKTLDFENHSYLYFCAKEDFSGYHSFAKSLSQHNANARRYQNALNRRGIR